MIVIILKLGHVSVVPYGSLFGSDGSYSLVCRSTIFRLSNYQNFEQGVLRYIFSQTNLGGDGGFRKQRSPDSELWMLFLQLSYRLVDCTCTNFSDLRFTVIHPLFLAPLPSRFLQIDHYLLHPESANLHKNPSQLNSK